MDKNVRDFLAFVKGECGKHEVNFNFSGERFVLADGTKCNGYFDDGSMTLAIAGGQPEDKWIKILVHEYAHMTQWLAQCKAWRDVEVGSIDSEHIITLWIDGEISLDVKQKIKHITRARNVELDCERRTLKLIKKFNLPVDIKEYTKNANAYIFFWTYVGISRKWYTIGKEPYNIPEITGIMPDHFNCDYDSIPQPVLKLFKGITND